MRDVPMPRSLSEEALREWLYACLRKNDDTITEWSTYVARAVRALLEAKVREAVRVTEESTLRASGLFQEEIVARVMGDHPSNTSGGHEAEGREAPRG